MKILKCLTIGLLIAGATSLSSCKKQEGSAGPAGADGKDGVANIKAEVVTTNNINWFYDNTYNAYSNTINCPSITQDVVDNGTVQVFGGDGAGTSWTALPFSLGILQYNYSYELGEVTIILTLSNGSTPSNPGGQQYKIVIIPPSLMKPNVNLNDYQAVKKAFNLAD